MPIAAGAHSAKFWDRLAQRYSKRPVANERAYQTKLRVTRGYLSQDMSVFEFGCGTGSTAITHSTHVRHIRAIDVSSKMLAIARAKADALDVANISFERATIDEFAVSDASFDAVLGLSILHLLDSRETIIAKVHAMLKPGGVFVTSTTCMGGTMNFFRIIGPIGAFLGILPTLRFFTPQQLANSLTDAGFEIDHQWQAQKNSAVFIVAKKPA